MHGACSLNRIRPVFRRDIERRAPAEHFAIDPKAPLPIKDGVAQPPQEPGPGIDLAWDFINNAAIARL